jgi:cellulose synthase/poly-beta-1,6-N-acetylglucosamine synthase-like glycosyltransferase
VNDLPKVSVVVPVRNEEKFISKVLDSLIKNDYPKDKMEILVVDGMSEDRTREIVKEYSKKYTFIKLLDNPYKYTPHALNIGIDNMSGEILMIAGAHTTYSKNYISECVKAIQKGYDVAGGVMITLPRSDSPKAIAIARVLSHPLGTGAKYRTRQVKEIEGVDTVAYALYKKEMFEKFGKFNENLIRNQDIEMNLRIKRRGGKTALVPTAKSYYYARDSFRSLWKNNFENGYWVVKSLEYAKIPFSFRHIVPMLFVLFLIFGGIFSFFSHIVDLVFFSLLSVYLLAILAASASIFIKEKDFLIFVHSFVSFLTLHLSYGLGSLVGLIEFGIKGRSKK